jgi:hypothetical protein
MIVELAVLAGLFWRKPILFFWIKDIEWGKLRSEIPAISIRGSSKRTQILANFASNWRWLPCTKTFRSRAFLICWPIVFWGTL